MERPSLAAMVVRFKLGVVTLERRDVVCAVITGIDVVVKSARARVEARILCRSLVSRSCEVLDARSGSGFGRIRRTTILYVAGGLECEASDLTSAL